MFALYRSRLSSESRLERGRFTRTNVHLVTRQRGDEGWHRGGQTFLKMPKLENLLPWWSVVFANVIEARLVVAYTGMFGLRGQSEVGSKRPWKVEDQNLEFQVFHPSDIRW